MKTTKKKKKIQYCLYGNLIQWMVAIKQWQIKEMRRNESLTILKLNLNK